MKFLVSSDWQLTAENLHKAELLTEFMLTLCAERKIKCILHLGDSKHLYNPLDVRVLNFKVNLLTRARQLGITWVQISGNHDRISMHSDSETWFPALRAAGAICVTRPRVITVASVRLACAPYASDPSRLRDALKRLARKPADLLLFHAELKGCKGNVLSELKGGVSVEDLYPSSYQFCIGGHIHLPQCVKSNVYFVGSPFGQDWGEANQAKRVIIYDSDVQTIESIRTPLPGMYDPLWPGFEDTRPESWKDAQVRIHVPCDPAMPDVQKLLHKAAAAAENEYPGAKITAIPEFTELGRPESLSEGTDDASIIKEYVTATVPPALSNSRDAIVEYLKHTLALTGFVRRASQSVRLTEIDARNVLCYKNVKLSFKEKGIFVVTGKNFDWPKRGNGSGKTSLMALPAIALFGRSLKGQANDKWVRRESTGTAWVRLRLRLQDGRRATVVRMRRPGKLRLVINDVDKSTGMGSRGTQKAIEALTGLTWEALRNAIYIDQVEINEILKGSDSERKAIFAKLLSLERFELAKELLKKELKKIALLRIQTEEALLHSKRTLETYAQFAEETDARNEYADTKIKLREATKCVGRIALRVTATRLKEKKRNAKYSGTVVALRVKEAALETRRDVFTEIRGAYKKDLAGLESITDVCATCKQPVSEKWRKRRRIVLVKGLAIVEAKIKAVDKDLNALAAAADSARQQVGTVTSVLAKLEAKLAGYESSAERYAERLSDLKRKIDLRNKYVNRTNLERIKATRLKQALRATDYDAAVTQYASKVFSKDGLPAFMIKAICPQLNSAAHKYSRIFAEDEIKVKFKIDDGSIDIDISNAHGGEDLEDQSNGETRIASIITSFAIREVINPANVLILDEPGEGLDAHNAKLFAQAIREIAKRFGTILLSTHSPIILAELEDEKQILVEKRNRIATVRRL